MSWDDIKSLLIVAATGLIGWLFKTTRDSDKKVGELKQRITAVEERINRHENTLADQITDLRKDFTTRMDMREETRAVEMEKLKDMHSSVLTMAGAMKDLSIKVGRIEGEIHAKR